MINFENAHDIRLEEQTITQLMALVCETTSMSRTLLTLMLKLLPMQNSGKLAFTMLAPEKVSQKRRRESSSFFLVITN